MDQYEHIRTAHRVYQKSIRQIARETGHTRETIRKGPAGFVAEVPEERESGMCGDGLGCRGNREMVEGGSGGVQEAEAHGASDLYTIS